MSKTVVPCGTAEDLDMLRLARVEMWHVLCLANHLTTAIWNELSPTRRNKQYTEVIVVMTINSLVKSNSISFHSYYVLVH